MGRGPHAVQPWDTISTWKSIENLVTISQGLLVVEKERYFKLLDQSHARLQRWYLGEPLKVNLGAHRWLRSDREESYSAWLAWILEQLPGHRHLFDVLDLQLPPNKSSAQTPWPRPEISREKAIQGRSSTRRLDIAIRYPRRASIIIETKVVSAEEADTKKQREYYAWLRRQDVPAKSKFAVMVAVSGTRSKYEGFRLQTWQNLCLRLRRAVLTEDMTKNVVKAAMILAFVGAVEQNILRFPPGREPDANSSSVNWMEAANHIEEWLYGDK